MTEINQALLILHFLGLALGFSASIANLMVGRLIDAATPADRVVLTRVPPMMGHVGGAGLVVLWVSGLALVFTRWGGFGSLPGIFHAKVTAVVVLTGLLGFTHVLQKRACQSRCQQPPASAFQAERDHGEQSEHPHGLQRHRGDIGLAAVATCQHPFPAKAMHQFHGRGGAQHPGQVDGAAPLWPVDQADG